MDLDFHNAQGILYPNTLPDGLRYGRGIFLYRTVHGRGFPQHTRTSLSVTHQNRARPVSIDCVCVCARAYFNYGLVHEVSRTEEKGSNLPKITSENALNWPKTLSAVHRSLSYCRYL